MLALELIETKLICILTDGQCSLSRAQKRQVRDERDAPVRAIAFQINASATSDGDLAHHFLRVVLRGSDQIDACAVENQRCGVAPLVGDPQITVIETADDDLVIHVQRVIEAEHTAGT